MESEAITFREAWRDLRGQGWKAKKPPAKSLDDKYRFIRPGASLRGVEGVDYLVGDDALLDYYIHKHNTDVRMHLQAQAELQRASTVAAAEYGAEIERIVAAPQNASSENEGASARGGSDFSLTLRRRSRVPVPEFVDPSTDGDNEDETAIQTLSGQPSQSNGSRTSSSVSPASPQINAIQRHREQLCPTSPHESPEVDEGNLSDSSQSSLELRGGRIHGGDSSDDGSESDQSPVSEQQPQLDLLADDGNDLNTTLPSEDPSVYGTMATSEDEDSDDMESTDDNEIEPEGAIFEEDEADDGDIDPVQAAIEMKTAEAFVQQFGGLDNILAGKLNKEELRQMGTNGWEDAVIPDTHEFLQTPYEPVAAGSGYTGLRQGYSGPSADAMRVGGSPIGLFFFFMPVALWQHIAESSNEYHTTKLPGRVNEMYNRYKAKRRVTPNLPKKSRRDIKQDLRSMRPIMPHELVRFISLLIARAIAPNRERLANHWKTRDVGGISRGAFGSVLSRNRFMEISRNLQFNSYDKEKMRVDRAWRVRTVVQVLQRTFARGYVAPAQLAFDEAILPNRSSFNKMRVYMKDKPHKWGTKLFMLCSAVTAYCLRFEVYCGKKKHASDAYNQNVDATPTEISAADMKSGQAAVVRNVVAMFGTNGKEHGMRLLVVDRFYTSVSLAIQLMVLGFYCVGTAMTNRLGYCKDIVETRKSRPRDIDRGTFKYARSKDILGMTAIMWWDSRPVHFLATGGSMAMDQVVRRDKLGVEHAVPCPRVVKDYHTYMGGVDVHDQLRLQRYSMQRSIRFRKYYKSLFLGFVDMAIVNAYIVYKAYHKQNQSKPLTHVKFLIELHLQLSRVVENDMYESNRFDHLDPARQSSTVVTEAAAEAQLVHTVMQVDEWRNEDTQKKRRRRACKVCSSLRQEDERAGTTTFYCKDCSAHGHVYLCMRAHRKIRGTAMTCWDIWHREWKNGRSIPLNAAKPIRMRATQDRTPTPTKRRRVGRTPPTPE